MALGQPSRDVSRETRAQLDRFSELLLRWNRKINLIGAATADDLETRHIQDSLQLLDHVPDGAATWLDLGSGAGLPGLVCAIADTRSRAFTLVESDQRKAAFLREATRQLGLSLVIHAKRIEQLPDQTFDIITARALAPLAKLLDLSERLCHPGTILLFPKGAGAESELTDAERNWHIEAERLPSVTDPSATVLKITGIHRKP